MDLQPLLIKFSRDAILKFLMGLDADSAGPAWASIRRDVDYCSDILCWRFRKPVFHKLLLPLEIWERYHFNKATARIHSVIDEGIAKTVAGGGVHELRRYFGNDLVKVRWAILELIMAGTHTTTSWIVHALYQLSRNRRDWDALAAEINQLGGKIPTTAEQLDSLQMLTAVLNESKSISLEHRLFQS